MRACPFPCEGYTPAPEGPEQEVHLIGREWHRGRVCPGSVVMGDPVVDDVLRDHVALTNFCQGNSLEWWNRQPQWWTAGISTVQRTMDHIKAEKLKRDE